MGVSDEHADHRIELVPGYPDGPVVGVLPGGAGHLVMVGGAGRPTYLTRSPADLSAWRATCSCGGWASAPWTRVSSPADEDLAGMRVHADDADALAVVERPDVIAAATALWLRDHLARLQAVAVVREAAQRVELALLALDDAVAGARRAGASWESIGAAAGITRQSAHARWARRPTGGRHR